MIKLNCPSCGAEVVFRLQSSIFAVCSFCKTSLVRQDKDLEMIGKMADLQADISPLQIGTTGHFENRKFELIGRMRVAYSDGYWNEWYALFDRDESGWLAEAQGFYGFCFPFEDKQGNVRPQDAMKPGEFVDLGPIGMFQVEDVRDVQCIYSEGELPMAAAQGRTSVSVDLTAQNNQMATIEYASNETRIFTGKYQDFDEFKFQNLREIDGW